MLSKSKGLSNDSWEGRNISCAFTACSGSSRKKGYWRRWSNIALRWKTWSKLWTLKNWWPFKRQLFLFKFVCSTWTSITTLQGKLSRSNISIISKTLKSLWTSWLKLRIVWTGNTQWRWEGQVLLGLGRQFSERILMSKIFYKWSRRVYRQGIDMRKLFQVRNTNQKHSKRSRTNGQSISASTMWVCISSSSTSRRPCQR